MRRHSRVVRRFRVLPVPVGRLLAGLLKRRPTRCCLASRCRRRSRWPSGLDTPATVSEPAARIQGFSTRLSSTTPSRAAWSRMSGGWDPSSSSSARSHGRRSRDGRRLLDPARSLPRGTPRRVSIRGGDPQSRIPRPRLFFGLEQPRRGSRPQRLDPDARARRSVRDARRRHGRFHGRSPPC